MKQWIKGIFYAPKHTKPTDENIMRLLLPSFVGTVICMVCLAGSTWAWFSASVQTAPQTIQAANYDIAVTMNGEPVSSPVTLEAGQKYTVTLTVAGNAPSGGYCRVEGGTAPLYTTPLLPGDTLTFTLIPEKDGSYTFTGVWGSYAGTADISEGCTVGQKRTETPVENAAPPSEPEEPADSPVPSGPAEPLPESTEPEPAPAGSETAAPEETPEPTGDSPVETISGAGE